MLNLLLQLISVPLFCIKCRSGIGRISACGGSGFAGGGGGRVSVVVFSWHHEPAVDVYGMTYAIFILSLLTVILDVHSPFALVIKSCLSPNGLPFLVCIET